MSDLKIVANPQDRARNVIEDCMRSIALEMGWSENVSHELYEQLINQEFCIAFNNLNVELIEFFKRGQVRKGGIS